MQNEMIELHGYQSFSQFGEDLNVDRILKRKENGFFIDIGAYHPFKYSNSYYFKRKNFRGINIEPNPENFKLFETYRKDDININVGISDLGRELEYHKFKVGAFNTFDKEQAQSIIDKNQEYLGSELINTLNINTVLEEHLPAETKIDFINLDCEGLDFKILSSFDFDKYAPSIFIVEDHAFYKEFNNSHIFKFMKSKGYYLGTVCCVSLIFVKFK